MLEPTKKTTSARPIPHTPLPFKEGMAANVVREEKAADFSAALSQSENNSVNYEFRS